MGQATCVSPGRDRFLEGNRFGLFIQLTMEQGGAWPWPMAKLFKFVIVFQQTWCIDMTGLIGYWQGQ
jgi:hypothetical protein